MNREDYGVVPGRVLIRDRSTTNIVDSGVPMGKDVVHVDGAGENGVSISIA